MGETGLGRVSPKGEGVAILLAAGSPNTSPSYVADATQNIETTKRFCIGRSVELATAALGRACGKSPPESPEKQLESQHVTLYVTPHFRRGKNGKEPSVLSRTSDGS